MWQLEVKLGYAPVCRGCSRVYLRRSMARPDLCAIAEPRMSANDTCNDANPSPREPFSEELSAQNALCDELLHVTTPVERCPG